MKKVSSLLLLLVCIGAFAAGVGEKLDSLSSPEWLDGRSRTLKEINSGKKFTVFYIWKLDQAALMDFSRIAAAAENFRKDAAFAGIGLASGEKLKRFPGVIRLGFPVNADPQAGIMKALQLKDSMLPLAVVLNQDNTVLWRGRSRALPKVLKDCIAGKFDLQEEIRRTRFAQAVNAEIKAQKFEKAVSMLHDEWLKTPGNMELFNAQMALLTQKLNRPEDAFKLAREGQAKNPGDHRFFESEYKLLGDPAREVQVPEFFERVKKAFVNKPGILMAFAIAEMGRSSESLDVARVLSLAALGWKSSGFRSDLEKGLFALEYAKMVHTFGRTDLAVILAQKAYTLLKAEPKRQEAAKKAALYYAKLQVAAAGIKIPDLQK